MPCLPPSPRSLSSVGRSVARLTCCAALLLAVPRILGANEPPASDELLTRLTKILVYGDPMGMSAPTKVDAVIALGLIGDERAVPVLVDQLQNSPNQQVRLQIARALTWIGSTQSVPALEAALQDSYVFVRKQAAEGLKKITGKDYDYDKTGLPKLPLMPAPNR